MRIHGKFGVKEACYEFYMGFVLIASFVYKQNKKNEWSKLNDLQKNKKQTK